MRLDELPDSDLRFLLETVGEEDTPEVASLRARTDRVEALAAKHRVYRRLYGDPEVDPLLRASPALVFLVLLQHTVSELSGTSFVDEVFGRERLPLFDTAALRDFVAAGSRCRFLVEVLASFTRVESGTVWFHTEEGWRRRRFNELDPVHLAQLVGAVSEAERPAVCRRLGDLALFLCGVFPEYVLSHPLEARDVLRIRRALEAAGEPVRGPGELALATGGQGPQWLMEWVGTQAYGTAARLTPDRRIAQLLFEIAERVPHARRILDLLTRRHLATLRGRWFTVGG